jgi:hypothetical protein
LEIPVPYQHDLIRLSICQQPNPGPHLDELAGEVGETLGVDLEEVQQLLMALMFFLYCGYAKWRDEWQWMLASRSRRLAR